MFNVIQLVTEAADFAACHHTGQTLKGRKKRPYINHLAEVAALVASTPFGDDPELVAAAYLHDVVEDEHATPDTVEKRFGPRVRELVGEVTDDMSQGEAERKRLQVAEVASKSVPARIIRLADKVSKVREMVDDPPKDWSAEKIRAYVEWARAVVDAGCRGLDERLEAEFDKTVQAALRLG